MSRPSPVQRTAFNVQMFLSGIPRAKYLFLSVYIFRFPVLFQLQWFIKRILMVLKENASNHAAFPSVFYYERGEWSGNSRECKKFPPRTVPPQLLKKATRPCTARLRAVLRPYSVPQSSHCSQAPCNEMRGGHAETGEVENCLLWAIQGC